LILFAVTAEGEIPVARNLSSIDYAAIVLYLLVTLGIAVWFGSRQKNTEDFFVGGRRMPWLAVGLSILATLFSTLSYTGTPGEFIKNGIGMFSGYLAVPFVAIVITMYWIPFFMRLRLTSAYEYLELRFSTRVRLVGATLFVLLRLGWMSMVVFAASFALDTLKGSDWEFLPGNDLYWWIGGIGLIAAIYTAIGGIEAVIWVDVLQCLLLLAGVLIVIGFVAFSDGTNPYDWWQTAQAHAPHKKLEVYSFSPFVRFTVVTAMVNLFFWTICTHGSDQVVLQRYFSTASLKAARKSYFMNLFVDIMMASLLMLAGLALLAFYLKHPGELPDNKTPIEMADKLFPRFLGTQLPAGLAGLIISAFLCDAIQTLEAGVNAITAVITKDLLGKESQEAETPGMQLTAVRWLTLATSIFVPVAACLVGYVQETFKMSIIDMMPKFFNMFVGPLAAMFFVGMFVRRCSTRSLLTAVTIGLAVSVFWSWSGVILADRSVPQPNYKTWELAYSLAIAVPCLTTFFTAALLGRLTDPPAPDHPYLWKNVVKMKELT